MTESELQTQVQEYLDYKDIDHRHYPRKSARKRKQLAGELDERCIAFRIVFWIELKKPGEKMKLTIKQIEFIEVLKKNEIPHIISNNFEEIKTFVDGLINDMSNM